MRKLLLLLLCLATIAKADTQTNAGRYFTPGGAAKYEFQDNSGGSVHSIALPSGLHTVGKATYDSTHTVHGKINVSNTVGNAQLDLTARGTGTYADIYLDSNSTGNPRIFLEKNNSEYGRIYGSNAQELSLYNATAAGIRFEVGGTTEGLFTPSGLSLNDPLSIGNGGTGSTTASGARSNLGVAAAPTRTGASYTFVGCGTSTSVSIRVSTQTFSSGPERHIVTVQVDGTTFTCTVNGSMNLASVLPFPPAVNLKIPIIAREGTWAASEAEITSTGNIYIFGQPGDTLFSPGARGWRAFSFSYTD